MLHGPILGTNTFFRHEGTQTIFEYIREENRRIECTFKGLEQLQVIAVLERLATKPEMSLANPLTVSIQDNLKLTLSLYIFSRREVLGALKRVLKSAKRHHKLDGSRGYLDFVKDYI